MPGDDFGFREEPFGVDPNIRFFYCDVARQHLHAELTLSIREGSGLVLLTGERGVGKTILLRHLADRLAVEHRATLLAPSGVLCCESSPSFDEIVRACHVRSNDSDEAADDEPDGSGLASFLEGRKETDPPMALILDGVEHLPLEALVRLKALSALPADKRGRLSIVLSGCLDASEGLICAALHAVRLNADVSLRLQRFQDRDVKPYVCHRIQLAGRKGPALFAPAAIERIIHYSKGNPLSINRFCRSTLVIASRQKVKTVSAEMVDEVAVGDLRGTTAEVFRDSLKGLVHALGPELPGVPMASAADSANDPSPPPRSVPDRETSATEDAGEKFPFRDESGGDAGGTTDVAAFARIPSQRPLEDYLPEDRVRSWPRERVGIAVRFVWAFLAVTLVSGVTGVYLAQTGRFDAVESAERWLDLLPGRESTLAQHDPRGSGFVGGQPSRWVEPTSNLDWEHPSKSKLVSSSGAPRPAAGEQRQRIGEPLQDGASPVKSAAEARLEKALAKAGPPAAPGSLPTPGATTKKAGLGTGFIRVAEIGDSVDSPEGAVLTASGVGTDETVEITGPPTITGSPTGIEPVNPVDEGDAGRELTLESRSTTETAVAAKSAKVVGEAGSAAAADQPAASDQVATDADPAGSDPLPAGKNIGSAANLGAAAAANGAQEDTIPETVRPETSEVRGVPQGLPESEPQSQLQSNPSEPEVLAPGEPPTPFRAAEATQPQLDLDRLLARGDQFLALGDVASAGLFYRLAATKGSAKGATALGSTYDPIYLERIGIVGTRPSAAEAIKWYRRAIDMGDRTAAERLGELVNRLERAAASGDGEARRILDDVGK